MDQYAVLIDGKDVETDDAIDVLDPSTGLGFAQVAAGGAKEVEAARAAFPQWSRTMPAVRSRLLRGLAGLKKSGHGREKGFEGLVGYTQLKSVVVKT